MKAAFVQRACDARLKKPLWNLLLIQIARHANDDGTLRMRQEEMAGLVDTTKTTMLTAMNRLEEKGYIHIERIRENHKQAISIITLDRSLTHG